MLERATPVTVTVCAVLQFAEVKVKVDGLTVASPVSLDVTLNTTLLLGCESNTTVKVAVVPDSATVNEVSDNVKPALSSSVVLTEIV